MGDIDNSSACDFMKCEFDCLPNINEKTKELFIENTDTYNETFMLVNSDKIIQKIKSLMKMRYFYKKNDLFKLINVPKKYPTEQIYAALTQIIDDNTEYIIDKYGRTGYLINIGDYYLFQPSELNYNNISIYDRSVPINYKHDMIKFRIKTDAIKPVIDKRRIKEKMIEDIENVEENVEENVDENMLVEGKQVLNMMFNNYKLVLDTTSLQRGDDNWYRLCGIVTKKMSTEEDIIDASSEERLDIFYELVINHIVESLMMNETINLLNYMYYKKDLLELDETKDLPDYDIFKRFYTIMENYIHTKILVAKGINGIVLFDGPSRRDNLNIFVLENDMWIPAKPQDKVDLESAIINKYRPNTNLNTYVGFIGFENNKKYMVYKVKDTTNKRSTGFRCDQSGKEAVIKILNYIETGEKYTSKGTKENPKKATKDSAKELCVRQELLLRCFEKLKRSNKILLNVNNKIWFLDTESAIFNEFEKKDKVK